jgi:hypothetical protein
MSRSANKFKTKQKTQISLQCDESSGFKEAESIVALLPLHMASTLTSPFPPTTHSLSSRAAEDTWAGARLGFHTRWKIPVGNERLSPQHGIQP